MNIMQHPNRPYIPALIVSAVTVAHSCPGCSTCGGSGKIGSRNCGACGGNGKCSHGGGR